MEGRRWFASMYVVECRRGHRVTIPCNWNVGGYCGVDARPCVYKKRN